MSVSDFKASSVRVDEALDRKGVIGPCKNAAAYRTVLLLDAEGQTAMRDLKRFLSGNKASCNAVLFPNVQVAFSRVAYRGEKPQMENDGKWEAA